MTTFKGLKRAANFSAWNFAILIGISTSIHLYPLVSGANPRRVEVVIDLDDTAIHADARRAQPEVRDSLKERGELIDFGSGRLYRMGHGLVEALGAISSLSRHGFQSRTSFFSAHGDDKRSEVVAKAINAAAGAKGFGSGRSVKTGRHILRLDGASPGLFEQLQPPFEGFSGKAKKDLAIVDGFAEGETILIDNELNHAMRGQEKNILWVRNKRPALEWVRIVGLLDHVMETASREARSVIDVLWDTQWERLTDGSIRYKAEFCEGEEIIKRGSWLITSVNPNFDFSGEHLASFARAAEKEEEVVLRRSGRASMEGQNPLKEVTTSQTQEPPTAGVEPEASATHSRGAQKLIDGLMRLPTFLAGVRVSITFGNNGPSASPKAPNLAVKPAGLPTEQFPDISGISEVLLQEGGKFKIGERVYLARDLNNRTKGSLFFEAMPQDGGASLLLQFAPKQHVEARIDIAQTRQYLLRLARYGIPIVSILHTDSNYIVYETTPPKINGENWLNPGMLPPEQLQLAKNGLRDWLTMSSVNRIYISDLSPGDLIWDGQVWRLIKRAGKIRRNDMETPEIFKRYLDRLGKRWGPATVEAIMEAQPALQRVTSETSRGSFENLPFHPQSAAGDPGGECGEGFSAQKRR